MISAYEILKYTPTRKIANELWYINIIQEIYDLRFQNYNTVIIRYNVNRKLKKLYLNFLLGKVSTLGTIKNTE